MYFIDASYVNRNECCLRYRKCCNIAFPSGEPVFNCGFLLVPVVSLFITLTYTLRFIACKRTVTVNFCCDLCVLWTFASWHLYSSSVFLNSPISFSSFKMCEAFSILNSASILNAWCFVLFGVMFPEVRGACTHSRSTGVSIIFISGSSLEIFSIKMFFIDKLFFYWFFIHIYAHG